RVVNFFFSSRRRHTRFSRDWSSDVCSSDLVTFENGDRFGARAKANGTVEVYQNNTLIATRDVSSWAYADEGGYIGLWFEGANSMVVDDFGGGDMVTPTPTPTATGLTPTPTATPTSTTGVAFPASAVLDDFNR